MVFEITAVSSSTFSFSRQDQVLWVPSSRLRVTVIRVWPEMMMFSIDANCSDSRVKWSTHKRSIRVYVNWTFK